MNSLFDVLLKAPLSTSWMLTLLFAVFAIHLLFVLLALGTAILSVFSLIQARLTRSSIPTLDEGGAILRTFITHKSLAVVLGIGALLLIQVAFTIPFFSAVNLFAPYWLLIIGCLIGAFIILDIVETKFPGGPVLALLGFVGLGLLLIVPGIFVAVLTLTENSGSWTSVILNGYKFTGALAWHWLFRYLHILGASIVMASAFHYFFTQTNPGRRQTLLRWLYVGLLGQIALGMLLYLSLLEKPTVFIQLFIFIGASAAAGLLWLLFSRRTLHLKSTLTLLLFIFIPMLLGRQLIQDNGLFGIQQKITANAVTYETLQKANQTKASQAYQNDLHLVYDNGQTIYNQSCAFCHGTAADGKGSEATNLAIPPEALAQVRTTRPYLLQILRHGINGTGMPYFTVFTGDKLEKLADYLDLNFHILGKPDPLPVNVSASALQEAGRIYTDTCSRCHGVDGRGPSPSGPLLKPLPPDFTQYTLTSARIMSVITEGYPGTAMPGFAQLPEDVRLGLSTIVRRFYKELP